jgi:hypothetical protein
VHTLTHESENNDDVAAAACLGSVARKDPAPALRLQAAACLLALGKDPRLQAALQVGRSRGRSGVGG